MTDGWKGSVALVTGGGSGIGRALSIELARRGAQVRVTDLNGESARRVAQEIGPAATASELDVRDARAFRETVLEVTRNAGRFDYLFNNAGIGVGGEAQELTAAHWDRIIDVNLRGVVHGVLAAYPAMVARRGGHIVNVASMAGLSPVPLLVPYAATKHAVVGLSTSLRLEAAAYGVRVSVLCPTAIETPILDTKNPSDLPQVSWTPHIRRFLQRIAGTGPYPVERLASDALDAVERNDGVIVIPAFAKVGWFAQRWAPAVVETLISRAVAAERAQRTR